MDFAKVDAMVRRESGKGNARKTRASGRVPAVLYGRTEKPVNLSLDPRALVRAMDKERRRNTVFSLAVSDTDAKPSDVTAMIRDVQIHPLTRTIVHVDFLRVSLDEDVRVNVPLVLVGTPVGVIDGGNLHQNAHDIPIAAKPDKIPLKVELDVSGLHIGEALHVSDLKMKDGLRALLDGKTSLASVVAPRADKEAEAQAATAAAAAEGAAAAPAAGAAADAKGGAAAKGAPAAKEGDKKAAPAAEKKK